MNRDLKRLFAYIRIKYMTRAEIKTEQDKIYLVIILYHILFSLSTINDKFLQKTCQKTLDPLFKLYVDNKIAAVLFSTFIVDFINNFFIHHIFFGGGQFVVVI